MCIELANKSTQIPKGVIENVIVKIDRFVFPVDFVVLDMKEDHKIPIILGRPFLATVHAMKDVFNKKISFEVGNETITFNLEKSMIFPPSDDDTCHSIDIIDLSILDHDLINLISGDLKPESEDYTKPTLFAANMFEGEKPTTKQKELLLEVLTKHKSALAWKVADINVVMSYATSAVTYTSVYTDFEPGKPFWGADDEEISEGGIPRVVAHDHDYVPEPIYPEYIPLEDDHEFPAEEQPLPPVDSPIAKSLGYVTESDPEEDPEEYEDDETEDGPVDYPMDGEDDGDDDDDDSSRDDADGEDEDDDEEEEEEEEHLAPADSAIVVSVDEPVFPPEGTEPVIPPPSTNITIGARITVMPQTSISLRPEAWVERLLAMTTPSPSPPPPILLLPPSTGERLDSTTQALIDAVPAALPSPLLPLLPPSLYIPPPVDRRDDILESEQPPHKRLYLSSLGSRYEVEESSTARPTRGRGIDYGFVSTVDAEERRQGIRDVGYGIRDTWVDPAEAVPEIASMTVGEVNTRVTELAELHEHDTHDLYALLEDAQDSRSRIS
ncbi:putative reverse transcriptase domain-containing protein [Tanacetum coccineum]